MKILVMGLAGSGKTTFAEALAQKLEAAYFNADQVRQLHDDWDFSEEGRLRQADRIAKVCETAQTRYQVADFICPTKETRRIFKADYVVWMDTIKECEPTKPAADGTTYEETTNLFEPPAFVNFMVKSKDVDTWLPLVYNDIMSYLPRF